MGRFNVDSKKNAARVFNHEGALDFALSTRQELFSAVVTCMTNDRYYESHADFVVRLKDLIARVDPLFVCQLAVYTRETLGLRSIPIVLLVELMKLNQGTSASFDPNMIGNAVTRTIARADEMTEYLAYYQTANGRHSFKKLGSLSSQLKRGIANAFLKFDEYQFAKYDRKSDVRLRDALFLTHPKAQSSAQQELFDRIANQSLATPVTWETQLSARGNTAEVWTDLIESGRLGYMAMLRNLRNILNAGVTSGVLKKVADRLSDRGQVLRAKQLPFRFLTAYQETLAFTHADVLRDALEVAVAFSLEAIELFSSNDRVLIACDASGSMNASISERSVTTLKDVGLLFGTLLKSKLGRQATFGVFASQWKLLSVGAGRPIASALELKSKTLDIGQSTDGFRVVDWAVNEGQRFTKIVFFTDGQLYDSVADRHIADSWKRYAQSVPDCELIFFDLAGSGSVPVRLDKDKVSMVSGLSDRTFDQLTALRDPKGHLNAVGQLKI